MLDFIESLFFVTLVVIVLLILPTMWLIRRHKARRRKRQDWAELIKGPYTGPTDFTFRIESTNEDLLDAFASQMRLSPAERILVLALGFFWVACAIVLGPSVIRESQWWRPLLPFCLGTAIIWRQLIEPSLVRRRIRQMNAPKQGLVLEFTNSNIHIEAAGVGVFDRTWDELSIVELAEKGVLIAFTDEVVNWLPNRVFCNEKERRAFAAYLVNHLPSEASED